MKERHPEAVTVVGGGVSGLTTAVVLAESGHTVRIICRERAQRTVSCVAAALWHPFAAGPREAARRWATRSLGIYMELAADDSSGVVLREGLEVLEPDRAAPWWLDLVPPCATPTPPHLHFENAAEARLPVVEMPRHVRYLEQRFLAAGGTFEDRAVTSFTELLAETPVVVNCTGLDAATLVPDPAVEPVRGQLVRTSQPGITRWFWEHAPDGTLTYIIPRSDDVILGGTFERGETDLEPSEETASAILERCRRHEPLLEEAQVLDHPVGLRPCRAEVRLERVDLPGGGVLLHDYGHGGGGITLSWGCAEDVLALIHGREA